MGYLGFLYLLKLSQLKNIVVVYHVLHFVNVVFEYPGSTYGL